MRYLWLFPLVLTLSWLLWPASRSTGQTTPAASTVPSPAYRPMPTEKLVNQASSLQGPASTHGVPEEMKQWLALRYASNPPLHMAMLQLATGWAQAIHEVHDKASARLAGETISRAIACVMSPGVLESSGQDQQWAYDQIIEARAEMLNKSADSEAYIRFQGLASGQYFADPGTSACAGASASS